MPFIVAIRLIHVKHSRNLNRFLRGTISEHFPPYIRCIAYTAYRSKINVYNECCVERTRKMDRPEQRTRVVATDVEIRVKPLFVNICVKIRRVKRVVKF